ncbi:disintegrin and metalloproteinase domain-containing protein 17, partial [Clonorchis sinensis]
LSERKRRSGTLQDKKLCRLSFIADYTFFTNVGSRSSPKTTRLIISLFYRINSLFQATKFLVDEADEQSGYGFLLGDIIIHESWNNELGHYNARSDVNGKPWTPRSLSTAFSYAQFNRTCLAHLLTYRPFMGVLGRAWTAAPELGGICSPSGTERGEEFKMNTGWTTYADYSGRRLLNAMAELITAHELGHNWGAAHDPDTEECSPPAHSRGKYLMYAHSVAGFAVNNYRFSPCSRRTVGATLAARAPLCFVATSESTVRLCGNRRLDPGEECDAGVVNDDVCCTDNCKLRPGAQCSPWNHDCCTSACQVAPPSTPCSERHSGNPCLSPGTCDGKSASCPGPTRLSGVPCAEHGRCIQGKCRTQCERLGLHTCICDEAEQSCYICCLFPVANSNSYTCRSIILYSTNDTFDHSEGRYSFVPKTNQVLESVQSSGSSNQQVYLHLENYRPCTTGYCMDGKCTRSPENSILRFWGFGADSKEYSFTSFLQNNLVVSVVTVSLLYIPSAYGIEECLELVSVQALCIGFTKAFDFMNRQPSTASQQYAWYRKIKNSRHFHPSIRQEKFTSGIRFGLSLLEVGGSLRKISTGSQICRNRTKALKSRFPSYRLRVFEIRSHDSARVVLSDPPRALYGSTLHTRALPNVHVTSVSRMKPSVEKIERLPDAGIEAFRPNLRHTYSPLLLVTFKPYSLTSGILVCLCSLLLSLTVLMTFEFPGIRVALIFLIVAIACECQPSFLIGLNHSSQVLRRRRRQRYKTDNFKVPLYTYELPSYPTQDETSSKGSRDTGIDSEMRASVDEAGGDNSSGPSEVAFHIYQKKTAKSIDLHVECTVFFCNITYRVAENSPTNPVSVSSFLELTGPPIVCTSDLHHFTFVYPFVRLILRNTDSIPFRCNARAKVKSALIPTVVFIGQNAGRIKTTEQTLHSRFSPSSAWYRAIRNPYNRKQQAWELVRDLRDKSIPDIERRMFRWTFIRTNRKEPDRTEVTDIDQPPIPSASPTRYRRATGIPSWKADCTKTPTVFVVFHTLMPSHKSSTSQFTPIR